MHVRKGNRARRYKVPPFALDDAKLREVLKHKAWQYANGGAAVPADITLEELERITNKRFEEYVKSCQRPHLTPFQRQISESHAAGIRKAGGYMRLQVRVAWLAWRDGKNSVQIAQETGVAPWTVRVMLQRMNLIARTLFPEDALPFNEKKSKAGKMTNGKKGDPNPLKVHPAIEMLKSGLTHKEAAARLGCSVENIDCVWGDWKRKAAVTAPQGHEGGISK